jgi:hypothetical protein
MIAPGIPRDSVDSVAAKTNTGQSCQLRGHDWEHQEQGRID